MWGVEKNARLVKPAKHVFASFNPIQLHPCIGYAEWITNFFQVSGRCNVEIRGIIILEVEHGKISELRYAIGIRPSSNPVRYMSFNHCGEIFSSIIFHTKNANHQWPSLIEQIFAVFTQLDKFYTI